MGKGRGEAGRKYFEREVERRRGKWSEWWGSGGKRRERARKGPKLGFWVRERDKKAGLRGGKGIHQGTEGREKNLRKGGRSN